MLIGFFSGFVLINGYWYYKIWTTFGNPVFPYFNNIFKSPYGIENLILNDSYTQIMPKTFWVKFFYPVVPIAQLFNKDVDSFGSWLFYCRDLRISFVTLAIIVYAVRSIFWIIRGFDNNNE